MRARRAAPPLRCGVTLLATSLVALAALAPGRGAASPGMLVGIADDGVTQRDPASIAGTIPLWREAGADVARVQIVWGYVAPATASAVQPAGFDPGDPDDPGYNWAPVDQTLTALRSNGIEPIISVTGFGPLWGSRVPARGNPRYKPDPVKFAAFASAVAQRYGAMARQYTVWNEPNLPLWLQPQFECAGGHCTPASPAIYRSLFHSAAAAIRRADPGARIYAGALAPRGFRSQSTNANMHPLTFLRALGCVDRKLRRERRTSYCRRSFKAIDADGIAYHPHGILRAPEVRSPDSDDAALADTARLLKTIDAIQHQRGLRRSGSFKRRFDLYYTEWGYQTRPPDPILGVSLKAQAVWLQRGAYLAWRQPRVRMLIQYLWRDDPIRVGVSGSARYAGWQSGLTFADGRSKPARASFPHPFWVDLPRGRQIATVWGQVRPGGSTLVRVQRRERGRRTYVTLKRLKTTSRGYFTLHTRVRHRTTYRFSYRARDARGRMRTVVSSTCTVTPR